MVCRVSKVCVVFVPECRDRCVGSSVLPPPHPHKQSVLTGGSEISEEAVRGSPERIIAQLHLLCAASLSELASIQYHAFSFSFFHLYLSLYSSSFSFSPSRPSLSLSSVVSPLSDCDSCLTLVVLTRLRLGLNATQPQVTSFLRSVCQSHPGILPKVKDL